MLDSTALNRRDKVLARENTGTAQNYDRPADPGVPPRETVSESPQMKEALHLATEVARFNFPVLIEGETGTGKSYLAQYIHDRSDRSAQPFIAQDCAALAEPLLDSELFGHLQRRVGLGLENRRRQRGPRGNRNRDRVGQLRST